MGITGLLPFLKNASRPSNLRELSGSTAAVDVYCWLHKGAFGCAEKLVLGQPTDGYVLYVMRYVDLLLREDIKPVLVFDGRNLSSKAQTEKKRRENRAKYRQMAKDYLREGKQREARECFQRCVDVTPEMARDVIRACQRRNVDCIVAPYEADAQLAHLCNSGVADLVVSEDSDLALFGCPRILFKLDASGNGVLYERKKLPACLGTRAGDFGFEKFRRMCITSGCDYLPSLPGIGLGKAFKFWSRVTDPELTRVLPKIPSYLNMSSVTVGKEYVAGFLQAERTFLYQLVFDTRTRTLRPLTDYPVLEELGDLSFAGERVEDSVALQMALGNLDLKTLAPVAHFDPDLRGAPEANPPYGKRAPHASVWEEDFDLGRRNPELSAEEEDERRRKRDGVVRTAFGDVATNKKRTSPKKRKLVEESPSSANEEGDDGQEDRSLDLSSSSASLVMQYGGGGGGGGAKRPKLGSGNSIERREGKKRVKVHSRYFVNRSDLDRMNSSSSSNLEKGDEDRRVGEAKKSGEEVVASGLEEEEAAASSSRRGVGKKEEDEKAASSPEAGGGGKASTPQKSPREKEEEGGNKKRKRSKREGESSSWLQCLDDAPDLGKKIIYNTDLMAGEKDSTGDTVKAGPLLKPLPRLSTTPLRSSEACRKAFKPVVVNEKDKSLPPSMSPEEKQRRRNPFIIAKKQEQQDSPPDKEAPSSQQQSQDSCSSVPHLPLSQTSMDEDSFNFNRSTQQSSSSQGENRDPCSASQASPQLGSVDKVLEEPSAKKSSYFASPVSPKIATKGRGRGSGSAKKAGKGVGQQQQRSVLDLWAKR